jgi:hypothetical protein
MNKDKKLSDKDQIEIFDRNFKINLIISFLVLIFSIYIIFRFTYIFYINNQYALLILFI